MKHIFLIILVCILSSCSKGYDFVDVCNEDYHSLLENHEKVEFIEGQFTLSEKLNIGKKFYVKEMTTSFHVDNKYLYIIQHIEDGTINIIMKDLNKKINAIKLPIECDVKYAIKFIKQSTQISPSSNHGCIKSSLSKEQKAKYIFGDVDTTWIFVNADDGLVSNYNDYSKQDIINFKYKIQ